MGWSAADGALIFGVILTALILGLGAWLLGPWGALGGGVAGFAGAAVMGLFPLWVVIVVFAVAVAAVVLLTFGKGESA
jgi:hypothetical protein